MKTEKPKTALTLLREEVFPGKKYRLDVLKEAGKKLSTKGREATIEFLTGKDEERPQNFQPPAKTSIVAQSRPFDQWPIVQVSLAVQKYIYGLTQSEFEANKKALYGETGKAISTESRRAWFEATGVDNFGFTAAQGINPIFSQAVARYEGVIKKVENRNEKKLKKLTKKNLLRLESGEEIEDFEPEATFNEEGRLLQPPGANPNIYCYQQISPRIYDPSDPKGVILPQIYAGYDRKPEDIISAGVPNRLAIPEGQPGYIPEHQRAGLKTQGRIRCRASVEAKARAAILAVVHLGEDWVVLDLRGLLRNVYWRKLASPGTLTLKGLLDFFTGGPVLDARRGIATFSYTLKSAAAVHAENTYKGKGTREVLLKLTENNSVALVTVDLGQRNPLAAMIARVSRTSQGDLTYPESVEPLTRLFLPDPFLEEVRKYRSSYDALRLSIREAAIASLTPEQQAEIRYIEKFSAGDAKKNVAEVFGIDPTQLPWDAMTPRTTYISDLFLRMGGDRSRVFFEVPPKKAKKAPKKPPKKPAGPRIVKRTDGMIARLREIRPRLSAETNKAFQEARWEGERSNVAFQKLSVRRKQFARTVVNHLVQTAQKMSRCDTVVLGIEDLNVPFFHGRGKYQPGWEGFFRQKKENRWLINDMHKALSERGPHRGGYVLELTPFWTSLRCPKCGHTDSANRDGDDFVCVKCGAKLHSDLEVATANLALVAITGQSIPRPPREQSSGKKSTGTARMKKTSGETQGKGSKACVSEALNKIEQGTARDPVYNPLNSQVSCPAP